MPDWYLDKGLKTLSKQLRNMYPGITIWSLGDEDHQGRPSDHNPEADGSVDAIDLKVGGAFTRAEADKLVAILVARRDKRIAYIIWRGRIISSTVSPWKWRDYDGSNPHNDHIHISVNDRHESDGSEWNLTMVPEKVIPVARFNVELPLVGEGDSDEERPGYDVITRIQKLANVKADGWWGPKTSAALGYKRMTEDRYRALFGLAR